MHSDYLLCYSHKNYTHTVIGGFVLEEIHNRIKSLRIERNLTLKELSDQTGLSLSFISQIERGTSSLSISSLKKISDALGIHINYFLKTSKKTKPLSFEKMIIIPSRQLKGAKFIHD